MIRRCSGLGILDTSHGHQRACTSCGRGVLDFCAPDAMPEGSREVAILRRNVSECLLLT